MFWLGCGNFNFTSLDPSIPAYWAERWELYKHQAGFRRGSCSAQHAPPAALNAPRGARVGC